MFFTFGTLDDLDFADLVFSDLLFLALYDFKLFKNRVDSSLETEKSLALALPTVLVDFRFLIFGTLDDLTLMLLAFLIFNDLPVALRPFNDLALPEE
jgi:hypothetical protein